MINITPQLNLWINWAVYAIYGKMANADAIMKQHRAKIHAAARDLMAYAPIEPVEVYRGIVLNEKHTRNGVLPSAGYPVTFISFSENPQVACFFGRTDTEMSAFLLKQDPHVKGYIATHLPRRGEVLFHHHWVDVVPLIRAASMHPHIEDIHQFAWYVKTQEEVILKPLPQVSIKPVEDFDCCSAEELNEMFTPPHLRGSSF